MFRRYALVRQHDQSDCGAAALATVALYHGRPVGLQQLRELGGTDQTGTNLYGLIRAAEQLGFATKAIKAAYDALGDVPLPAIVHVQRENGSGHFMVLQRVGRNTVVVADPAEGMLRFTRDEFCQLWTGYLLMLLPDETGTPTDVRPFSPAPWKRLLAMVMQHRAVLTEAFFCSLLMTLLGITTSYFIQHLVDSVLVRGESRLLNALGIGMGLILAFRALFGIIRRYLLAHVGRQIDLVLASGFVRHVVNLPTRFFETRQVGEILSRLHDTKKIQEAISGATLTVAVDGIMVLFASVVLWFYDPVLAAVATLFIPALAMTVLTHQSVVRRRAGEAMENEAKYSAHLVETVGGVDTLKAYGLERERSQESETRLLAALRSSFALQMLDLRIHGASTLIAGIAGIVVLWFGGHRVIAGALTIGELMFFSSLLTYLLDPLERLAAVNLQIQDALVANNRVEEIMQLPVEQRNESGKTRLASIQQGIELRNVTFRYGCRAPVLKDVSMEIPSGTRVAIVGESGSGKSTLLKLLTRAYDPTQGSLRLDGTDYRDFTIDSLRSRIGLVAQDPFVFAGSIRENIALGAPAALLTDVVEAARSAGLEAFIDDLPDRYETIVGERGANLSGGQRQRLAIARALFRRPDLVVFDEATSHLDTLTEQAIQESLRDTLAGKTVVLVAHRLSTIAHVDLVYVLRQGRIVEHGTPAELLKQGGQFAALWAAQLPAAGLGGGEPSRPPAPLTRTAHFPLGSTSLTELGTA